MHLILASSSPRRRELLTWLDLTFTITKPDIDETPLANEPADQYVMRLSREKALAVRAVYNAESETLIIAADTTVALDSDILGKPTDSSEAIHMLQRLRARAHTVYTGITICQAESGECQTSLTTTSVFMRDYTASEIDEYVASGEPLDKAGSYGIQHAGFHPVERIDSCYANVMGLPLCTLRAMLVQYGVVPPKMFTCSPELSRCALQSQTISQK